MVLRQKKFLPHFRTYRMLENLTGEDILEKQFIEPAPQYVMWLYAEDQPLYHTMDHVVLHRGILEDLENRFDPNQNSLLIMDDLITQCNNDPRITRLFSVESSHRNLIIIFIVKGKEMCTISLNSHYVIVFKNPRDNLQMTTLSRQMYPGKLQFLISLSRCN